MSIISRSIKLRKKKVWSTVRDNKEMKLSLFYMLKADESFAYPNLPIDHPADKPKQNAYGKV